MDFITFCGNPLDRASYRRGDPRWIAAQREIGLFLPFWQGRPYLKGEPPRAALLAWRQEFESGICVFLGLEGNQPVFAIELCAQGEPTLDGGIFQEMRPAAFRLPGPDTAIAGQAKALLDWHRRHGFCPNCGAPTVIGDAGYRRHCPNCGAEHFPRTDPVVIMLPVFDGRCLVGHNKRFAPSLYSAFAGFVEPGESMEEAVRRELKEEVNLAIGAVSYRATQPWPFPSSLMLGCRAQALSDAFKIDNVEIEDARWLSRQQIQQHLAGQCQPDFMLPVPIAIAHHLIKDWALDQD